MAATSLKAVIQKLRSFGVDGLSDRQLVDRFIDFADEAAFATLVRRHGRMVLGLCRRTLGPGPDAEDSLQATFVILARKAKTIRKRSSLASWLHGVAQRVSLRALSRRRRSRLVTGVKDGRIWEDQTMSNDPAARASLSELAAILDEELQRLPAPSRDALIVCLLEGRSHIEAAEQLGWPLGTLKGRLSRGRDLLRQRLERRGIGLTGIALSVFLTEQARAFVPATLLRTTVQSAAHNVLSPTVAALAKTVVPSMAGKLKAAFAVLFLSGVTLAGFGGAAYAPTKEVPQRQKKEPQRPAVQAKMVQQLDRVDLFGDPLPEGAIMRLGTVRLRPSTRCCALAFSPVSDVLATASFDGPICLWDIATGKVIRQVAVLRQGWGALAFSPDGKLLAAHGGGDSPLFVWDIATGKEVNCFEGRNAKKESRAIAFSPSGNLLALGDNTSVRLFDVKSGNEIRSFEGEKEAIRCVAFAPDGLRLVGTDTAGNIFLWETDSAKVIHRLKGGPSGHDAILGASFSKDGKLLFTSGQAQTIVWNSMTGEQISADKNAAVSHGSVLSPDGKLLAFENRDHVICLWDWVAGKEVRRFGTRASSNSLLFSRDGKLLASAGEGAIRLWDVESGTPKGALAGHQDRISSVVYTADGRNIVTEGWDGTVRVWDPTTGKEQPRPNLTAQEGHRKTMIGQLRRVFPASEGATVAILTGENTVAIWDVANHRELHRFNASSVAFSPDGKLIATAECGTGEAAAYSGTICLYERLSGKKLTAFAAQAATIKTLSFLPDSKTLASHVSGFIFFADAKDPGERNEAEVVRLWDVAHGKEVQAFPGQSKQVQVAFSPDGRTFVGCKRVMLSERPATNGTRLILFERATGSMRTMLTDNGGYFQDIAYAPNGKLAAFAFVSPPQQQGIVLLVDPFSGAELARFQGHLHEVTSVAFSPDSKTLVSGSLDTTALLWDVSKFTQHGPAIKLTPAELDRYWKDLLRDSQIAFGTMGKLVGSTKETVDFLAQKLQAVPLPDENRIAELVSHLGNPKFITRDDATRELEKLGDLAGPTLRKALDANPSPEMKNRVYRLLEKLDGPTLSPETLRHIRAIETLEYIATSEARLLLKTLAEGAAAARQTKEAQASLIRLAKRS